MLDDPSVTNRRFENPARGPQPALENFSSFTAV
jgi:hypothetical protein